jgi:hypothetical protein
MRRGALTLLVVAAMGFASAATADDIVRPTWRGNPGSTMQTWEFDAEGQPIDFEGNTWHTYTEPTIDNNPFGTAVLRHYPGYGQPDWIAQWAGREGVLPLSGAVRIEIPNDPTPNPQKDVWLQITWLPQYPDADICAEVLDMDGFTVFPAEEIQTEPLANGWMHTTYNIRIEPNPQDEVVWIQCGVLIDEIVVDTLCFVPEPASLALLSFGGLAALLRRKR